MSDPFIAEIKIFTCNYAPYLWADCNGQTMYVSQSQGLFAIIGSYFGGDWRTTFALPDLQSRAVVNMGQGAGLQSYQWGAYGGDNSQTINSNQLPAHTHTAQTALMNSSTFAESSNYLASLREMTNPPASQNIYSDTTSHDSTMNGLSLTPAFTGPAAHENRQPFLALRFCIALQGVFPIHS